MSRMVVKKSPRLGLDTWSEGTDLHPNRAEWNAQQLILDDLTAIDVEVPTWDARPQTAVRGTYMWVVDEQRLYRRTATSWQTTARIGGGGRGEVVRVGGVGEAAEGSSPIAARADHTHSIPVATRSTPGAMSAEDKTTLDLHRFPTRINLQSMHLDSITDEGVYYQAVPANATVANGYPIESQSGALVVTRFGWTQTFVIQEWTEWTTRRRWVRSWANSGAWKPWQKIADEADLAVVDGKIAAAKTAMSGELDTYKGTVGKAVATTVGDLNDLRTPGTYLVTTASNKPDPNAEGLVRVWEAQWPGQDAPAVFQEFWRTSTWFAGTAVLDRSAGPVWRRNIGGPKRTVDTYRSWSVWERVATGGDVETLKNRAVPSAFYSTSNLNNMTSTQVVTVGVSSIGLPVVAGGRMPCVVEVTNLGSNVVRQSARPFGTSFSVQGVSWYTNWFQSKHHADIMRALTFERHSTDAGATWGPWQVTGTTPWMTMAGNTSDGSHYAIAAGPSFPGCNAVYQGANKWRIANGMVEMNLQVTTSVKAGDSTGNIVGSVHESLRPPSSWQSGGVIRANGGGSIHSDVVNAGVMLNVSSGSLYIEFSGKVGGGTGVPITFSPLSWPIDVPAYAG